MNFRNLIPWRRSETTTELAPVASLQRDINQMFDDFFKSGNFPRLFEREGFTPLFPELDLSETDKHIDVTAEIPGMTDKDIKLQLSDDGDVLTIEGEKRSESETRTDELVRSERRYGKFRRVVTLPSRVDVKKVEATCKDGVLKVHMNRLPASARQIPVKSA